MNWMFISISHSPTSANYKHPEVTHWRKVCVKKSKTRKKQLKAVPKQIKAAKDEIKRLKGNISKNQSEIKNLANVKNYPHRSTWSWNLAHCLLAGTFVGPQISKLMGKDAFESFFYHLQSSFATMVPILIVSEVHKGKVLLKDMKRLFGSFFILRTAFGQNYSAVNSLRC